MSPETKISKKELLSRIESKLSNEYSKSDIILIALNHLLNTIESMEKLL